MKKKCLTPIEETEPHLLRERCRAGTGPSNVKETRGANITSPNLTSPPLSEAAVRPAIPRMISSRALIGRLVCARLPPSPLNKTLREESEIKKRRVPGPPRYVLDLAPTLFRYL